MKKFLFYFLNFTWGLPLNIFGGIVSLIFLCFGKKPKIHGGCIYFEIGNNWGGFEIGLVFLTNKNPTEHIKNHEFGHAIQNAFWGCFYPITIWIWSIVRYHYRKYRNRIGLENSTYDSIWFECQASYLGEKYYNLWEKKNEN